MKARSLYGLLAGTLLAMGLTGVAAADGVGHDGTAEQTVKITLPHAFVDGVLKRAARDMNVLPNLCKHNGHTGILADGKVQLARRIHVGAQVAEDGPAKL